jgi:hypothetical protein
MSSTQMQRRPDTTTPTEPAGALRGPDPYRDERPSLLAENARLRAEITRLKRRRALPAVASLAAYLVILTELGDWLNGTDPVRYWVALLSLGLAFCVGLASAIHLIAAGRD